MLLIQMGRTLVPVLGSGRTGFSWATSLTWPKNPLLGLKTIEGCRTIVLG